MYSHFIKYKVDFIFSLVILLIILPLIVLVSVFLIVATGTRPFFFQKRPGRNDKIFKLIKFRTMTNERDSDGKLLPDSQRLTGVGKFIRALSIDELPQFFNVLKGDMSLVGPRPLLVDYLPLYNELQARRHEVRPGLTGWAQINGRNAISWDEKFNMDVWYVDHVSFRLDLIILFLTILKIIKRDGINSGNAVTMEKFTGSQVSGSL